MRSNKANNDTGKNINPDTDAKALLKGIGLVSRTVNEPVAEHTVDGQTNTFGHFETVQFSKDTELFKPGDACKLFLIVLSGTVRVELTTKNGRVVTLYKIDNGESCILTTSALLNDERYYTRGITESEVTAIALQNIDFQQALNTKPEFAKYVMEGFSTRMSSIVGLVDRMATRDISASIVTFILDNHIDGKLTITQQNIAMQIGTAREVISRKLSELESQGLISRDRGVIHIIDRPALQEIAGL